jgi:hypothetical protein
MLQFLSIKVGLGTDTDIRGAGISTSSAAMEPETDGEHGVRRGGGGRWHGCVCEPCALVPDAV